MNNKRDKKQEYKEYEEYNRRRPEYDESIHKKQHKASNNRKPKHKEPKNNKYEYKDQEGGKNQKQSKRVPRKNTAGMILCFVYFIIALLFTIYVWTTGMVPFKYLAIIGALLLALLVVLYILCLTRSRVSRIIGIVLSSLLIVVLGAGFLLVYKADHTIGEVSDVEYKVDNMVLVVRNDDPAQELADTVGYEYAIQNSYDTENTALMVDMIGEELGEKISPKEYQDVIGLAQALIDGEIDAAIYNQANHGILEESIEAYSSKVRVIYQYGIKTEAPEEAAALDVGEDESFNVYLSGIDTFGDISSTSRSDVNIIMTVNPKTHHILLTNTPRDYYVEFPGLSNGEKDKLTHAGIYGVNYSMDALANLYGTTVPYYMRVNFSGFETVIDVLGGVDVNSEYAFSTDDGYSYNQGINHLEGKSALAFARERHAFSSGDNQRGKNQQAVITAVIQKATSPAMIGSAFQLLDQVKDVLQTNMPEDMIKRLINNQLAKGGDWTIESQAVIGYGANSYTWSYKSMQVYIMVPDEASVAAAAQNIQTVMEEETFTDVIE